MKTILLAIAALAFSFAANAESQTSCENCCGDKCAECCKGNCKACCK